MTVNQNFLKLFILGIQFLLKHMIHLKGVSEFITRQSSTVGKAK